MSRDVETLGKEGGEVRCWEGGPGVAKVGGEGRYSQQEEESWCTDGEARLKLVECVTGPTDGGASAREASVRLLNGRGGRSSRRRRPCVLYLHLFECSKRRKVN